jgi:DNA repair exonuclease SbcCD ATPase subunit
MRILNLTLKNFRSHIETVLELDRFTFVRGPNGCGKSSIQMALEYLFTGRCEITDAAGRGAEALIRTGAKDLEVSATLENGETICRRRTSRSHIVELNRQRVTVDAAEASLEKRFGPTDVLSAVLHAGRFIEMPGAEQKKLLAQVVAAGKADIPHEISDALRSIHEEPPRLASVADVEAAHRRFYDLRAETNRALRALGQMNKPDIPSDLPPAQEVKRKLEDLRQQKERLVAQKAQGEATWESTQARLQQVQAEIEEVSAEIVSPSEEFELASRQGEAERLRQVLTGLIAEQKAMEASLAALEGLGGKCPTCRQPMSADVHGEEIEALRERLAELDGLIQGTNEELNENGEIAAAASRLEGHRKALARRVKLEEEQAKLRSVPGPATGDLESRMTILAERINKGERVLEKAQHLESARERWEWYVGEKSTMEARIRLFDRLVEYLGPNAPTMGQVSGRIGSFTEDLNRHLAAFRYSCSIAFEPFDIRVSSSEENRTGLSLKHLSESERFRFGAAFQIALAIVTGLRFVVIDRADVLDKEKRKMLTGLLLNSGLDQAIILATSDEAPSLNVPKGVKFVSLAGAVKPDTAFVSTAA